MSVQDKSINVGTIGRVDDGISGLAKRIRSVFKGCVKKVPAINNIAHPYRINRLIRSKYKNGDYEVVHPVLHHYAFEIDGRYTVFGIAEVIGAIQALEKYEAQQVKSVADVGFGEG